MVSAGSTISFVTSSSFSQVAALAMVAVAEPFFLHAHKSPLIKKRRKKKEERKRERDLSLTAPLKYTLHPVEESSPRRRPLTCAFEKSERAPFVILPSFLPSAASVGISIHNPWEMARAGEEDKDQLRPTLSLPLRLFPSPRRKASRFFFFICADATLAFPYPVT